MDVRQLSFDTNTFDVVIDKGAKSCRSRSPRRLTFRIPGTMDAMMASVEDVWNPSPQVVDDCTKEVNEVVRVLRPSTGVFIYLTFGQPHFRR